MTEVKKLIGRNLKVAREIGGLSQEELAANLDISRATLSAIENGHAVIDSEKLLQASKLLSRPVTDFFREEQDELALLYRAAEKVVPNPVVTSRFRHFCQSYRELEEMVGVADTTLPPPEYTFFPHLHSKSDTFAVQVAASERDRLGLGQLDALQNIFKLLDCHGVRIKAFDIDQDGLFGLSAFSKQYGPCLLVNSKNTLERDIFTAAHEYGHLVMHRDRYANPDRPSAKIDVEVESVANTFAAHFLVPELGLREFLKKTVGNRPLGLEDIVSCKHYFRVSLKVMTRRLFDIGAISEDEKNMYWKRADQLNNQEFAPLSLGLIDAWRKAGRFETLCRKAIFSELISLSKLAELRDEDLIKTRTQVQLWRKEMSFANA